MTSREVFRLQHGEKLTLPPSTTSNSFQDTLRKEVLRYQKLFCLLRLHKEFNQSEKLHNNPSEYMLVKRRLLPWKLLASLPTTEASVLNHMSIEEEKERRGFFLTMARLINTSRNREYNEMSKLWKEQAPSPPPPCPHLISQTILNVTK